MYFIWVSMYSVQNYSNWGHYILRLLLETEPPFYVVIQATRRSSHLLGKGSTFISQLFQLVVWDPGYLVRPQESNPRPSALQSRFLPTELILPRFYHYNYWNYEYMKTIYVNCGVKNYLREDHRSYIRNFCSCGKKFRTSLNFFSGFLFATA